MGTTGICPKLLTGAIGQTQHLIPHIWSFMDLPWISEYDIDFKTFSW